MDAEDAKDGEDAEDVEDTVDVEDTQDAEMAEDAAKITRSCRRRTDILKVVLWKQAGSLQLPTVGAEREVPLSQTKFGFCASEGVPLDVKLFKPRKQNTAKLGFSF